MSIKPEGYKMLTREKLKEEYLDFINNYISIDLFAEHRGLTYSEAEALLNACRSCFMSKHPEA